MRFGRRAEAAVVVDEPADDDGLRAHITGNDLHGYTIGVYNVSDGYTFTYGAAKTVDDARDVAREMLQRVRADRAIMAATKVDEVIR